MSTDVAVEDASETYEQFLKHVQRIANVEGAGQMLAWDQRVMMPEGGTPSRARQLSTLSAIAHESLVSNEMGDYLDELKSVDLSGEQRAAVREVRRRYDRETAVPTGLVEAINQLTSEAHAVWKEAKETDDFEVFAPTLERLVQRKREYAAHVDPNRDPYEVLFEEYDPYLGLDTVEAVLETLREELVPLIDDLQNADATLSNPFTGTYDEADQQAAVREVLDVLGYDWDRGRLDTAPHPFAVGNQYDARVTTRYNETDPIQPVTGTIHEFGHAFYTLGLPDEAYGTPLGSARGLIVHESQSRLWENHVARSRPFWDLFGDAFNEHFETDATTREFFEAANQIDRENRIRVRADELTYHMHIILRFEIERDLIRGDLAVEEVPRVWNDKMEAYLGVRPESDAEGCLQDNHWSHGYFGYFPTYSLGSVLAAQLYATAEADIDGLDDEIRDGNFEPLSAWLRENVHRHGQRYRTDELIERATGEPFTADYFVDYAHEKFGTLYGV